MNNRSSNSFDFGTTACTPSISAYRQCRGAGLAVVMITTPSNSVFNRKCSIIKNTLRDGSLQSEMITSGRFAIAIANPTLPSHAVSVLKPRLSKNAANGLNLRRLESRINIVGRSINALSQMSVCGASARSYSRGLGNANTTLDLLVGRP